MKEYIKSPLVYIIVFFSVIYLSIIRENMVLSDDLARILTGEIINKNSLSFFKYISDFINSPTMTSRPVSGFIYGSILYISKHDPNIYYINYVFFLLSLIVVFILLKNLLSESLASIVLLIYSLSMVSSSMVFSPIMMNANLAVIFYCLSLIILLKNKSFWISLIFYFLSVLSYEILIPCLILNTLILDRNWQQKILYFSIGILGVYGYREILEPSIFSNYFHRDQKSNIFNVERNYTVIKYIFSLIFIDIPKSIYRSILAIRYYSLFDFFSLVFFISIFGYFTLKIKNLELNKKILIFSTLGIILSFSVFFFSGYNPNLHGFYNRNLGGLRLFSSLFIVLFLLFILKKNLKAFKYTLLTIVILLVISTISIKNAWIYASHLNDKVFSGLKNHLNNDLKKYPIYIMFDAEVRDINDKFYQGLNRDRYEIYQNRYFVLKEPIYMEEWESDPLQIKNGISLDYSINYFFYSPKEKPKHYYIYDFKTDTLKFINN